MPGSSVRAYAFKQFIMRDWRDVAPLKIPLCATQFIFNVFLALASGQPVYLDFPYFQARQRVCLGSEGVKGAVIFGFTCYHLVKMGNPIPKHVPHCPTLGDCFPSRCTTSSSRVCRSSFAASWTTPLTRKPRSKTPLSTAPPSTARWVDNWRL